MNALVSKWDNVRIVYNAADHYHEADPDHAKTKLN